MVIVKVKGNLTINEGVKVTAYSTEYGGPKGMLLYTTGKLTNNGEISMTAKGAYAEGEDVYLWQNKDESYEYVPAAGGAGAPKTVNSSGAQNGSPGLGRQTGGGSAGDGSSSYYGEPGAAGTSYSGGTGGTAYVSSSSSTFSNSLYTTKENGGPSGKQYNRSGGTGAGNPAGTLLAGSSAETRGENGTGGLLTIYAGTYENNGSINSNGSKGGLTSYPGGSSGGGSVNIFIGSTSNYDGTKTVSDYIGSISADPGISYRTSGAECTRAGAGTYNIGTIIDGTYSSIRESIVNEKEKEVLTGNSIYDIIKNNDLENDKYYIFKVSNQEYTMHVYNYNSSQVFATDQVFGSTIDVGSKENTYFSEKATAGVVVKINGNLTINENVKLTAFSEDAGGPKGLFIFVTGKTINNGEISMTAKGAHANGESVYLYDNKTLGTIETVPAVGATGGGAPPTQNIPLKGGTPTGRQTGGGMSGVSSTTYASAGGTGTSYSGGTGGAGVLSNTEYTNAEYSGTNDGGHGAVTSSKKHINGGVGNPGGISVSYPADTDYQNSGTGGLLTLYTNEYLNAGKITSQGVAPNSSGKGGGSGSGSINVFINNVKIDLSTYTLEELQADTLADTLVTNYVGTYDVSGIKTVNTQNNPGTYNVGSISTGDYADIKVDIQKLINKQIKSITSPTLSSLSTDKGTFDAEFDPETETYTVTLDSEDYNVNISAVPTLETSTVEGTGNFDIDAGTSTKELLVTSSDGYTNTYTLVFKRNASSYKYLSDIKVDGVSIENYNPETLTYTVNVSYAKKKVTLEAIKGRPSQEISGDVGEFDITSGSNEKYIDVLSEDGQTTTRYTININKGHTSLLESLVIDGITVPLDLTKTEYDLDIYASSINVVVNATPYDEEAEATVTGNKKIFDKTGTIKIRVVEPNVDVTIYTINVSKTIGSKDLNYGCTGQTESVVLTPGDYLFQAWGAQGGASYSGVAGGKGGYSTGNLKVSSEVTAYINVGCEGEKGKLNEIVTGGYNGGGNSGYYGGGSGGGASDIRLAQNTLLSRVIVAGAGGGSAYYGSYAGGYGGGASGNYGTGYSSSYRAKAGTQTAGGAAGGYSVYGTAGTFGVGGNANTTANTYNRSGGGGAGWYGGGGSGYRSGSYYYYGVSGGAGGSGYVYTAANEKNYPSGKTLNSNYYLTNAQTYAGNTKFVTTDQKSTETGHSGDGHVRIYQKLYSQNNYLENLKVIIDGEEKNIDFDPLTENYEINNIAFKDGKIEIEADLYDELSEVSGAGTYYVDSTTNVYNLYVTSESGDIRTYTVTINGTFDLDLDTIENSLDLDYNKPIQSGVTEYTLNVPNSASEITLEAIPKNKLVSVSGNDTYSLNVGENEITFTVKDYDNNSQTYTLTVIREGSDNNYLKSLSVKEGGITPSFDKDRLNYEVNIRNNTTSITVDAEPEDENATVSVLNNNFNGVGSYDITVRVTAENGEIRDYNITTHVRTEEWFSDLLATLSLSEGSFNETFDSKKNYYTATLDYEVSSVVIYATPVSEIATATIYDQDGNETDGRVNLNVGENTFNVTVSVAGNLNTYTIVITRNPKPDATLKAINLKKFTLSPEFDSETTSYTTTVSSSTNYLTMTPVPTDSNAKVTVSGNENFQMGTNTVTIHVVSWDDSLEKDYTIVATKTKSNNNYLKSLQVNGLTLTPTFDKTVNVYSVDIGSTINSVTIAATPEDSMAKVTGIGSHDISLGSNPFNIVVTAEDGSTRTYTVNVNKYKTDDSSLKSLKVSEGSLSPAFSSGTKDYTVKVDEDVNAITVTGTKNSSKATVRGNGEYELIEDETNISIIVTAEDGSKSTYTVKVVKEIDLTSKIKDLEIKEGELSPEFDSRTYEYYVYVPYEVTELKDLNAEKYDENATVTVEGNSNFKVGMNDVIIRVVSETSERIYTIHVIRQEQATDTRIDTLKVTGTVGGEYTLTPTFSSETDEVYFEVEADNKETGITVEATAADALSLEGPGEYEFTTKKKRIYVTVTNENGIIRTYSVVVKRKKSSEARLSSLKVKNHQLDKEFDKDIEDYSLETLDKSLVFDEITTLEDTASYEVEGNSNFTDGENTVTITVTAEDGTKKEYTLTVDKLDSTNNNLKSLTVENYGLDQRFNKDTLEYTVHIPANITKVNVQAELEDENSTLSGTGEHNTPMGDTDINVTVTNYDGEDKVYTITVIREDSSLYLTDITLEGYSLNETFDKETTSYTATVPSTVSSINVSGTLEDEVSTLSGYGLKNLNVGENTVTLTVKSFNNKEKKYTVIVTREDSSKYLSSLGIEGYTLNEIFDKEKSNYTLTVPSNVSTVNVIASKEEDLSTLSGTGNKNLNIGENQINVKVTTYGGTVNTYTITVTREDSSIYLNSLSINGYALNETFNKEVKSYTATVPSSAARVTIQAQAESTLSSVDGIGSKDLNFGSNEYTITVTSANGVENEYTLTITREDSSTNLSSLSILNHDLDQEFDAGRKSYTATVENDIKEITINASLEDTFSSLSGTGKKTLDVGENTFNIIVTSAQGITNTYTVTVTRKASDNANLKQITSTLGDVTKIDDSNYKLVVEKGTEKIYSSDVIVEAEDSTAEVTKAQEINLYETLDYPITITSASGNNVKEYTLKIEFKLSDDDRLKTLTASTGRFTENFDKDLRSYVLQVFDTDESVTFAGEVNEENATILTSDLTFDLDEENDTEAQISVQAENGTIGIYTITIKKELTREKYLAKIEVTGVKDKCESCEIPEFNETTYEYEMTVPFEVKQVGFEINSYKGQSVTINDENVKTKYNLNTGVNQFRIVVINSIDEVTTYTYKITRLKNSNNYLQSLRLTNPETEVSNFYKEITEYTVHVESEYESVEVEALPLSDDASVSIKGNTKLRSGNNDVIITVTAENGETRDYILHVIRKPSSNNLLKSLQVIGDSTEYELSPKFQSGIEDYTLTVEGSEKTVTVYGEAEDSEATVEGNDDYDLSVGVNKIEIKVTSADNEERIYTLLITRESTKNTNLSNLEVTNGEMSPVFDKDRTSYDVSVAYSVNSLNLNIETEDPEATYTVLGNDNLSSGKNIVRVVVTNSDQSDYKIYTLVVTKQGSNNNYLKSLKIDGTLIDGFDKTIDEYNLTVETDVNKVRIEAEAEDEKATVSNTGLHSLSAGKNVIEITVTSETGIDRVYTVNITRNVNVYLSTIITDLYNNEIDFVKTKNNYELTVANNVDSITVLGLVENRTSTVEGNGRYDLHVGENIIKLIVTNGDAKNTYQLTVTREASDNAYLEYLTVAEGSISPSFDKETNTYSVTVPNDITSLSIDYAPEDKEASVTIEGNSGDLSEVKVIVTSTKGTENVYTINVTKDEASSYSNYLEYITVNSGELSPEFNKTVHEYNVTVSKNTSNIVIDAEAEDENARVRGIGSKTLSTGRNVFPITVTGQDNKVRTYTLIVYRVDASDARLEKLSFNEGNFTSTFNRNTLKYTLKVGTDAKLVSIKEIKTVEEGATYEVSGDLTLQSDKIVKITVTSKDKSETKVYTVNVSKAKSTNSKLKSLTSNIGEFKEEFSSTKYAYNLNVDSNVNSITLTGIAEDENATVSGDGVINLTSNTTKVNILVTAENGSTSTYTVIINKSLSTNANLKDLSVKGYSISPDFDKDTTSYVLNVGTEVENVVIEAIAEENTSTVSGDGIYNLDMGANIATVTVTSGSGSIKTYTVTINREASGSANLKDLYIDEGVFTSDFSSKVYEYYVTIPNEYDEVTIHYEKEDEEAEVLVSGNESLEVGENIINVKVTNGSKENTYKLHVMKNAATNNYLKSLTVSSGGLSPAFSKDKQNYQVNVGNDVEKITVTGVAELETSTVSGNGEYTLSTGDNLIVITVTSHSGYERKYKVNVVRSKSSNANLKSITLSEGTIAFDKATTSYNISLPIGTTELEVEGIAEESTATVSGNGKYDIEVGENTISLVVTAENGNTKTYTIKATREASSNTNLTKFEPSTGSMNKEFSNTTNEYELEVESNVNVLDIEVETESEFTSVMGNESIEINDETQTVVVTVIAEDGTTREIELTIRKKTDIIGITVDTSMLLVINNQKQIEYRVEPFESASQEVEYEYEDEYIEMSGNKVTGIKTGMTQIVIKSKSKPEIKETIDVTILSDQIESEIYEVTTGEADKEYKYVIGAEEGETIDDFKSKLLNDNDTIKIYDKEGNEVEGSNIVATGLTIKLIINEKEYDEAVMIVRGDLNEDGQVDVSDKVVLQNHLLAKETIENYILFAADVESDGLVDVSDNVKLGNYILRKITTLN